MPDPDIRRLFQRYYDKSAEEQEIEQLMDWIADPANEPDLIVLMREHWDRTAIPTAGILNNEKLHAIRESILAGSAPARRRPRILWIRFAAAAAVLILFFTGYWLISRSGNQPPATTATKIPKDVPPGGNKAILTLANGSTIILDSAEQGLLSQQGATFVTKTRDGQLLYNAGAADASTAAPGASPAPTAFNTIATPRGGQYEVILPDGSKVWLNASSSLRFPTAFGKDERSVQLTGEAYFEIEKDETRPFRVSIGNQLRVEVLGTSFDIMSYEEEDGIRTSLLQGKVRVARGAQSIVLNPSQQAIAQNGATRIAIADNVPMDKIIAWKEGRFDFVDDDIYSVMRQLQRWYNIDVEYLGHIPIQTYTGEIRRQVPISQVLHMLELAGGLQFEIKGEKITVRTPSK